jgi:hypothetical protein
VPLQTLEVDDLPQGLCLTRMARVSSPVVRRTCEQFPTQVHSALHSLHKWRMRQICSPAPLCAHAEPVRRNAYQRVRSLPAVLLLC